MREEILAEVSAERERQREQWGEQVRQFVPETVCDADGLMFHHGLEYAESYKRTCERRMADGTASWWDILLEEVTEAMEVADRPVAMREELVQVAAVVVQMIEAVDLAAAQEAESTPCVPIARAEVTVHGTPPKAYVRDFRGSLVAFGLLPDVLEARSTLHRAGFWLCYPGQVWAWHGVKPGDWDRVPS